MLCCRVFWPSGRSALFVCLLVSFSSAAWSQTFEVGSASVSDLWTFIPMSGSISNPVVVVSLPTTGAGTDAVLKIRGVTPTSFQARLVTPSTTQGPPTTQVVGWLAVEAGTHTVGNTTIAAGLQTVSAPITPGAIGFVTVSLPPVFTAPPAVLGATQTAVNFNDDFVVTRARNVTAAGFDIGFQRQESLQSIPYGPETLGWIAWEVGTETVGGWFVTATVTPDNITSTPSTFVLDGFGPGTMLADGSIFGMLNRFDGADPAWAAGSAPIGTSVDLFVDEETSANPETDHTTEAVALLAFSPVPTPVPLFGFGFSVLLGAALGTTGAWRAGRRTERERRGPTVVGGEASPM